MSVDRDLAERGVRQLIADAYGTAVVDVVIGQPTKIEGASVVTVLATGEERPPFTARGLSTDFYFEVNHFVIRADTASNWTPRDAERKLNALAKELADVLKASKGERTIAINDEDGAASFTSGGIFYNGRSRITPFNQVGGEVYELEVFPLKVCVFGGD